MKHLVERNTVIDQLYYLYDHGSPRTPPAWPPDLFALAGSLLLKSGAYRRAMIAWPPSASWEARVGRIAKKWRVQWNRGRAAPGEVRALWQRVLALGSTALGSISDNRELCVTLVELCAIADETSFSLGIPPSTGNEFDKYYIHATELLTNAEHGATLCESIHPSKARVLPKMHTPQSGLTFRSFSLHLALYLSNEMRPEWVTVPSNPDKHKLNLLLIPWPYVVEKNWFRKVSGEIKMPPDYGFFEYVPDDSDSGVELKTATLLDRARRKYSRIDGVVFPELALTQRQYLQVHKIVLSRSAFLMAGVASAGKTGGGGKSNCVHFDLPLPNEYHSVHLRQAKHHRWRLDRSQVARYGLKGRLGARKFLWEHVEIEDRCIYFVALRPWLTVSVLICEDLARPDPVGDVVRAVGPNLVVSLLLDGPQLSSRWSARYAAALADDPGCSVLTLTSIGMANLSCPLGKKDPGYRFVALWRDGGGGQAQAIQLPESREGIVLQINVKERKEYTADGRNDYGATGYPILEEYGFV
jgi:hypothetical protein